MRKKILIISGVSGVIAVVLGALGAHALKQLITEDQLKSFETGSDYHIYHTLALLILIPLSNHINEKTIKVIAWFFGIGIILFSGSIYLLACRDILGIESWKSILGPITPLGGISFIAGWLTIAYAGFKSTQHD